MDQPDTYLTIDDFANEMATRWSDEIKLPSVLKVEEDQQYTQLYELCRNLVDELAPRQIVALNIDTVKSFLLAQYKGVSPATIVHCYLTSPTDNESLKVLKELYRVQKPTRTSTIENTRIH